MKISDMIKTLECLKNRHGDKEVFVTVNGSFDILEIESVDISLTHPGRIIVDTKRKY